MEPINRLLNFIKTKKTLNICDENVNKIYIQYKKYKYM